MPSPTIIKTSPIDINNLRGRIGRVKSSAKTSKEILLIYDQDQSIESMEYLADSLSKYASVTIVDLPGLGGMDSFYKSNQRPTLEIMSAYLAALIKLRVKNNKITLITIGSGLPIAITLLQKQSQASKKVNKLISIGGFVHMFDLNQGLLKRSFKYIFYLIKSTWVITKLFGVRNKSFRTKAYINMTLAKLNVCNLPVVADLKYVSLSDKNIDENTLKQHLLILSPKSKIKRVNIKQSIDKIFTDKKQSKKLVEECLKEMI